MSKQQIIDFLKGGKFRRITEILVFVVLVNVTCGVLWSTMKDQYYLLNVASSLFFAGYIWIVVLVLVSNLKFLKKEVQKFTKSIIAYTISFLLETSAAAIVIIGIGSTILTKSYNNSVLAIFGCCAGIVISIVVGFCSFIFLITNDTVPEEITSSIIFVFCSSVMLSALIFEQEFLKLILGIDVSNFVEKIIYIPLGLDSLGIYIVLFFDIIGIISILLYAKDLYDS